MSFKRIVNLDLRHVSGPAQAPLHAIGRRQHDDEIVDAIESTFEFLSRWDGDRDGHSD